MNLRSEGVNPRALGTNPRALGTNPRAEKKNSVVITSAAELRAFIAARRKPRQKANSEHTAPVVISNAAELKVFIASRRQRRTRIGKAAKRKAWQGLLSEIADATASRTAAARPARPDSNDGAGSGRISTVSFQILQKGGHGQK